MLVKNAQNLMGAVIGTIQAAEAAYMKVSYNMYHCINFHLHHATEVFILCFTVANDILTQFQNVVLSYC